MRGKRCGVLRLLLLLLVRILYFLARLDLIIELLLGWAETSSIPGNVCLFYRRGGWVGIYAMVLEIRSES